ncbi:MAG: hypothetical protein ABSH14_09370 [Verrucomicrobiia bacterium]|jgi:hypothetical protein
MDISEREIKQDFTIFWPVTYIFTGIIICGFLFAAAVSHNLKYWLFFLGAGGVLVIFVQMCLRSTLHDMLKSGESWKLTDAGLQRVYPSGKPETIRWEQIRHMRWVRYTGLIIRWDESKAEHQNRSKAFKDEFQWDWVYRQYQMYLLVQQDEARELLAIAENKTGLSYERLAA